MQRLKSILRQALGAQSARVTLQVGQAPKMMTGNQEVDIAGEAPFSAQDMQACIQGLFPQPSEQQSIGAGQHTRGLLDLKGVAKIPMIVEPGQGPKISLYMPPNGQVMFQQDWQNLSAGGPPQVAAPPPPPAAGGAGGFVPPGMDDPAPAPVGAVEAPAPAPMAAPDVAQAPPMGSGGGFVPPGMEDAAPVADAPEPAPAPAAPEAAADQFNADDNPFSLASVGGSPPAAAPEPAPIAAAPEPAPAPAAGGFVPPGMGESVAPDPTAAPEPVDFGGDDDISIDFGSPAAEPAAAAPAPEPAAPAPDFNVAGNEGADLGMNIDFAEPAAPAAADPAPMAVAPATAAPAPAPAAAAPVAAPVAPAPTPVAAAPAPAPVAAAPVAAPPVAAPVAPTAVGDICWEAEVPGTSAISEGHNPIDELFRAMIKMKSSDMHLTTSQPPCFRVDGEIQRTDAPPIDPEQMRNLLWPIMPERNKAEFAEINDTDFAYEVRGLARFRINIFRDRLGVGAVMRQIPAEILTAEQLGVPAAILEFCNLTKGLVVVTGPTGSGKSTTLAAMVDRINKSRPDHILTIEDPIEFVHQQQMCLINQREVHRHTSGFSRALKAALREDPDIVLVGEMRDLETIEIGIETAETGHLVFGTLHTNTAVSTVDRIIQQFPADQQEQIRMMLAEGLKGVVAQTLLKRLGGGRVAAHEILVVDNAVAAMIREGKNPHDQESYDVAESGGQPDVETNL